MKSRDFWKNFALNEELCISGTFIYNGLRKFYEIRMLEYSDEIFEVLYELSVGTERLLKVAVVLLEDADGRSQEEIEDSLITHNHLELLRRVRCRRKINLASPHNEFLSLLSTFYNSHRYDRFKMTSITDLDKERNALCSFLSKRLAVNIPSANSLIGTPNEFRYKKFLRGIVTKISQTLYEVVCSQAQHLNLYTYELRHGSKAWTIFRGGADIPAENVLWKELLLYFMNTKSTSKYLEFLRGIEPLDFDPGLVDEYLDCFQSDAAKSLVLDELNSLYENVKDKGRRLDMLDVIGSPNLFDVCDHDGDD